MKECPSCKAWCFDDMETCFGCLHRFGREEDEQTSPSAQMADALSKSSLLGSAKRRMSDTGMKVAASEDGGAEAKDATFDKKDKVVPFAGSERVVIPSGTVRPFEGGGAKAFSLREGWILRIEVPESGDDLVVRLERPLP